FFQHVEKNEGNGDEDDDDAGQDAEEVGDIGDDGHDAAGKVIGEVPGYLLQVLLLKILSYPRIVLELYQFCLQASDQVIEIFHQAGDLLLQGRASQEDDEHSQADK